MTKRVAFLFALLLLAIPLYTSEAEAQETTVQRIAKPIANVGDIVIRIAERLFAMPMDLAGYVVGAVIGFSDAFSANMVTRTAMALVLEVVTLALDTALSIALAIGSGVVLIAIGAILVVLPFVFILLATISLFLSVLSLPFCFTIFGIPFLILFLGLAILFFLIAFFLMGALILIYPVIFVIVGGIPVLTFVVGLLFSVIPLWYLSSGFRPVFRALSSPLASIINFVNGCASRFPVVALLWSEFYDGLLRGSSISPYVRNFFQIVARGLYLEQTPLL